MVSANAFTAIAIIIVASEFQCSSCDRFPRRHLYNVGVFCDREPRELDFHEQLIVRSQNDGEHTYKTNVSCTLRLKSKKDTSLPNIITKLVVSFRAMQTFDFNDKLKLKVYPGEEKVYTGFHFYGNKPNQSVESEDGRIDLTWETGPRIRPRVLGLGFDLTVTPYLDECQNNLPCFRCNNSRFIHKNFVCNGRNNCGDMSDEQRCTDNDPSSDAVFMAIALGLFSGSFVTIVIALMYKMTRTRPAPMIFSGPPSPRDDTESTPLFTYDSQNRLIYNPDFRFTPPGTPKIDKPEEGAAGTSSCVAETSFTTKHKKRPWELERVFPPYPPTIGYEYIPFEFDPDDDVPPEVQEARRARQAIRLARHREMMEETKKLRIRQELADDRKAAVKEFAELARAEPYNEGVDGPPAVRKKIRVVEAVVEPQLEDTDYCSTPSLYRAFSEPSLAETKWTTALRNLQPNPRPLEKICVPPVRRKVGKKKKFPFFEPVIHQDPEAAAEARAAEIAKAAEALEATQDTPVSEVLAEAYAAAAGAAKAGKLDAASSTETSTSDTVNTDLEVGESAASWVLRAHLKAKAEAKARTAVFGDRTPLSDDGDLTPGSDKVNRSSSTQPLCERAAAERAARQATVHQRAAFQTSASVSAAFQRAVSRRAAAEAAAAKAAAAEAEAAAAEAAAAEAEAAAEAAALGVAPEKFLDEEAPAIGAAASARPSAGGVPQLSHVSEVSSAPDRDAPTSEELDEAEFIESLPSDSLVDEPAAPLPPNTEHPKSI